MKPGALSWLSKKNAPIVDRFFATTLMPPSFFRNSRMTIGITIIKGFSTPAASSEADIVFLADSRINLSRHVIGGRPA
jgi:hypothetical protein